MPSSLGPPRKLPSFKRNRCLDLQHLACRLAECLCCNIPEGVAFSSAQKYNTPLFKIDASYFPKPLTLHESLCLIFFCIIWSFCFAQSNWRVTLILSRRAAQSEYPPSETNPKPQYSADFNGQRLLRCNVIFASLCPCHGLRGTQKFRR